MTSKAAKPFEYRKHFTVARSHYSQWHIPCPAYQQLLCHIGKSLFGISRIA
jgi:hypothetical protein